VANPVRFAYHKKSRKFDIGLSSVDLAKNESAQENDQMGKEVQDGEGVRQ
jgi:hypothetical protein